MGLEKHKDIEVGIVGPIDLRLLNLQKGWEDMPDGNEYPIFSYYTNYLIAKGIKVVIYTTAPDIVDIHSYQDDRIEIYVAPKTSDLFKDMRNIHRLIKKRPVCVLYAQWTYEFAWAATFTDIKTIVTVHDNADRILKISPSQKKQLKAKLNDVIMEKAKQLVTVSDYLFQRLSPTFKPKASTIANAYPEYLPDLILPYEERENYFVTFSNGFGRRTNAKKAVDAFKIFAGQKHYQHYHYHLIGYDTDESSQLFEYAEATKAPMDRITFHGYLHHPKAMEILRKATLLIHPSLEEANSISIIEALVLGVPVIGSTQSPGVIEQLIDGRGFLCNTGKPREIYETIIKCLKDPENCAATAMRAQEDALRRYQMQHIVEQYAALCP